MVEFKELRIVPDGKNIIIEASVEGLEGVYLDSIVIDTQDTYIENGPSTSPVYSYTVPDEELPEAYTRCGCNVYDESGNLVYISTSEEDLKATSIRLVLDATDIGTSSQKNLFFVYVIASDDTYSIMGVIADLYPYYKTMMYYIKEVECDCEIPKWFIDRFLRFKAVELSLKTGHYTQAIEYWNRFFVTEVKCNCDEGT